MNILVLCTGNSARSILLESCLNVGGVSRLRAYSAGSRPTGQVHPQSLKLLAELGHDTSGLSSKSWDRFAETGAPEMDFVITVCSSAAGEACPLWPGAPLRAHWGVEDPAAADPSEWEAAFRTAYRVLARRAAAFLALEFETMDRADLQATLNEIGDLDE